MHQSRPRVVPVSLALGAQVSGIDLSAELSDQDAQTIEQAFHEHSVLVFPGQDLSIDQQRRFAGFFGEVEVHAHLLPMTAEGHPDCMVLHNDAARPPGLNAWHTDNSGWREPPLGTVLHAKITPRVGGDTLFSNMYLAYQTLSPPMQELVRGLRAVHDIKQAFGPAYATLGESLRRRGIDPDTHFDQHGTVEHPLVRTHPETERDALYVSGPYVTGVAGLSKAESDALLGFLYRHIETSEFVYRHQWSVGDVVIWDNRCTQHLAVADYHPHERLMHRMNIAGERPFLAA